MALLLGNTKLSRNLMHNTTQHTSLRATLRLQLCTLCDQFSVAALSANSFPKHKANLATQNVVSLPHHTHLRHILTVSFLFGNSARRSQYYKRYIRLHRVYQGCSFLLGIDIGKAQRACVENTQLLLSVRNIHRMRS